MGILSSIFGSTKKTSKSTTTNTQKTVSQAGGSGQVGPIAATEGSRVMVSLTDQGSIEAGARTAAKSIDFAQEVVNGQQQFTATTLDAITKTTRDAFDFGDDAIDSVTSIGLSALDRAGTVIGDAIELAANRSQSESSQQSESLIRLAIFGVGSIAAVFIARSFFK